MKLPLPPLSLPLLLLLLTCANQTNDQNHSKLEAYPDTLTLQTEKVRGSGLFGFGAGFLELSDTSDLFPYPVKYPADITDIIGERKPTDFRLENPAHVDIIVGRRDGSDVFVVDQNGNHDFTDDPVRPVRVIDESFTDTALLIIFHRRDEGRTISDSAYIRIGASSWHDGILYGRDEYLKATFALNNKQYEIGIIDQMMSASFTYGDANSAELAILAVDTERRDTLLLHDRIMMGEYLKVDDHYYRFDSISRYGDHVLLVKDPDFLTREGTQVGTLAPDFEFVTVAGDSLSSNDLHDKPILIANSCGCGGDKASTEAFTAIRETYAQDIHALRLDSDIKDHPAGWHVDVDDAYNESIYNDYRGQYCSRVAYLIGQDRRINEKFDITNWGTSLPPHLHP